MPPSSVKGDGSVSVKRFTPTSTCSPDSIRAIRARWDSTSAAFMYGTASTVPPCSATRSSSARAPSTSSATSPSITTEPSNRSGYSSRSVS